MNCTSPPEQKARPSPFDDYDAHVRIAAGFFQRFREIPPHVADKGVKPNRAG